MEQRLSRYKLFMMWEPSRDFLIQSHKFYYDQANQRLLSQFENIDAEAETAADLWLEQQSPNFDPDRDDPGSFYERANDKAIEFYQLLTEMHERTRLSVVAGMYHEWDKQFRKWTHDEIKRWHRGQRLLSKIWSIDIGKISELFSALGWDIRGKAYFSKLRACRLVVNVFKHGDGTSLNELKQLYPEYLESTCTYFGETFLNTDTLDYTSLRVSDEQIKEFSEAIVSFWLDIPEEIAEQPLGYFPQWFQDAINFD